MSPAGLAVFALLAAPLVLCGCAESGAAVSPRVSFGAGASASPAAGDPVEFGRIPEFRLSDQNGAEVTRETLRGRPYVACAIFTTCTGPCPRISAGMRELQEALAGTDALLVSVSVDPGFDSPEVLASYAAALGAEEERWLFLTGAEEEVYAFVRGGLKLGVDRAAEGEAEPGRQVTHGTQLVAVDRAGSIRGWYGSQTDEELELLRARMLALAEEE